VQLRNCSLTHQVTVPVVSVMLAYFDLAAMRKLYAQLIYILQSIPYFRFTVPTCLWHQVYTVCSTVYKKCKRLSRTYYCLATAVLPDMLLALSYVWLCTRDSASCKHRQTSLMHVAMVFPAVSHIGQWCGKSDVELCSSQLSSLAHHMLAEEYDRVLANTNTTVNMDVVIRI